MASLVSALDSMTPKQVGENNHQEYGWSGDIEEKILQLSFQLTRTKNDEQKNKISKNYYDLIKQIFDTNSSLYLNLNLMCTLLKLMFQTRDLIKGKGEYGLFYILLGQWVKISKNINTFNKTNCEGSQKIVDSICKIVLKSCISIPTNNESEEQGYGSWKDMKYFMNYMKNELKYTYSELEESVVFKYMIEIMVKQLKQDNLQVNNEKCENISLISKWIPREKSKKFGWIAKHIAKQFYYDWIVDYNVDKDRHIKSVRKAMTYYRRMISTLNKKIDTVQIKQCGKTWSEIDFDKGVTSITLSKQKNAFNYMDKRGNLKGSDNDRIKCRDNYKKYISDCSSGKKEIKSARCNVVDLVKDAMSESSKMNHLQDKTIIDTINLQWEKLGEQVGNLGNMIAMVDTSGSMTCDNGQPLYAAIGLGCRIAEKSKLGKRVMTFSSMPAWVNLEGTKTFTEMVNIVKRSNWGMTTNFYAAMAIILDACIKNNLQPEEVSDLVLVIFSDMQMNQADTTNTTSLNKTINKMFHDGGMKSKQGKPYNAPHVLFWNLRSTSGFPALSIEHNISMLSGFSPVLLNTFCEKGMEALIKCTPMSILMEQLNNDRYVWIDSVIETIVKNTFFLDSQESPKSQISTDSNKDSEIQETQDETDIEEISELDATEENLKSGWFDWWYNK